MLIIILRDEAGRQEEYIESARSVLIAFIKFFLDSRRKIRR